MNKGLLFLAFFQVLLTCITAHAQSGFVYRYMTPEDEYPNDIIETPDGGFIITASVGTYPLTYKTLLIRLNQYGDTIGTRLITQSQGTCYINDIIKLDNGLFMGVGEKKKESDPSRIWFVTFTDSLKIVHDTSFLTTFQSCNHMIYGFIDHFHDLIVYGSADPYNAPPNPNPFAFKLSQNCDSLLFQNYYSPYGPFLFSMMEKPDTSGYYMSIFGCMNPPAYSPSQFLTINYSLDIISMDSIPKELALYNNTKKISEYEFFETGKKYYWNSDPRTDKIGIIKLDTAFQVKAECFFGPDDTTTYPAYNTNLDFLNPDNLYLGGVANQDWGGIFSYNHSYILLGKLDSSLNLKWQKRYGGDTYYMVWSIIATTDGGCIIGASTNDYATQGEQRDIYILKVDSNGIITGINHDPPSINPQISIYPNPGRDLINVITSLTHSIIYLYDLTGREIFNQSLVSGSNSVNVLKLKPGLYIYKILQNSEVRKFGKWIKE